MEQMEEKTVKKKKVIHIGYTIIQTITLYSYTIYQKYKEIK